MAMVMVMDVVMRRVNIVKDVKDGVEQKLLKE